MRGNGRDKGTTLPLQNGIALPPCSGLTPTPSLAQTSSCKRPCFLTKFSCCSAETARKCNKSPAVGKGVVSVSFFFASSDFSQRYHGASRLLAMSASTGGALPSGRFCFCTRSSQSCKFSKLSRFVMSYVSAMAYGNGGDGERAQAGSGRSCTENGERMPNAGTHGGHSLRLRPPSTS